MATSVDGAQLPQRELSVPEWVVQPDVPLLSVRLEAQALRSLQDLVGSGRSQHCRSLEQAVELITQVCGLRLTCISMLRA